MLEAAYATFFDEVYLRVTENYQKSLLIFSHNEKIWQFIDEIATKCELFYLRFSNSM